MCAALAPPVAHVLQLFKGCSACGSQAASAGGVPSAALAAALCFAATAAVINAAYVSGVLGRLRGLGPGLWQRWRALLGCVGPAMVAQALTLAVWPATTAVWPAAAGATAAIAVTVALSSASSSRTVPAARDSAGGGPSSGSSSGAGASARGGGRGLTAASWAPFWATVPAWSATALLMMGPAVLLVRKP